VIFPRVLALSLLFAAPFAYADDCAELYAKRAESPVEAARAARCYSELEPSLFTAERASMALSWAIRAKTDRKIRLAQAEFGLTLAEKWIALSIPSGAYWRSVFSTFEANIRDGKSPIPTHMMKALSGIKADLRSAREGTPGTHFHGPARVLGIIDLSAPKIAGGDPERAYQFLEEARLASPESTLNQLWVAKALIKLRRTEEARVLLQSLVALPPSKVDPDWVPETREDQAEAAELLKDLR
jgi:tetratricopeptide (TPR) repeat protein